MKSLKKAESGRTCYVVDSLASIFCTSYSVHTDQIPLAAASRCDTGPRISWRP